MYSDQEKEKNGVHDVKISPARSPRGNVRNLRAMSDQKFFNLVVAMPQFVAVDPEAARAVLAEAGRRS